MAETIGTHLWHCVVFAQRMVEKLLLDGIKCPFLSQKNMLKRERSLEILSGARFLYRGSGISLGGKLTKTTNLFWWALYF